MGELKSKASFLRSIETREGKVNDYGGEDIEYTVVFDVLYVKEQTEKCEEEIDDIQDELDKFNHITNIEIK